MKKNILLMYAVALLHGMVFYGPVATLYRQAQGVSIFQITLIESISLILCLLFEIPWGIAADRIGYKKTMVFCCTLYFVSKIVFWLADGFWWFLLERILLSIVISGLSGVDSSILYLSCGGDERQDVFGIYNSLQTAGLLAAAAVFSSFIGDNYRLAAKLTLISYGLAALAASNLVEVKESKSPVLCLKEFRGLLNKTLKNRYLLLFLIAVAFLTETHQTVTVFLNQPQFARCGLSPQKIGYVYIAATLAGVCGALSARLTGHTGIKSAGTLFYTIAAVSCLLLTFSARAGISIAGILALRVSNSLFQPLQMDLQNRMIVTGRRATALSINAMITDSIGAGINLLFGAFAKISLSASFLFGAALCTAGLCLYFTCCSRWDLKA